MAYTYFPARQTNFFPPQVPYFAGVGGLRGMHGLGDYAGDLAAYKAASDAYRVDKIKWDREKVIYDAAVKNYDAAIKQANDAYATAVVMYAQSYKTWQSQMATYEAAIAAYNVQYAGIRRDNIAKAQKIAATYGITLPQAFLDGGACLSQAQRDAYARNCTTVKGFMGLGSADPDCGWKLMPLCNYPVRPTAPIQPKAPQKPTLPARPTLRPQPVAPVQPSAPPVTSSGGGNGNGGGGGGSQATPDPLTPSTATDDTKKAGMISNGLILLAVGVGGYLVYRTFKKPKAA